MLKKKTLIYRRAVFVKTGQLNELGGYKPRTSGRRTCKFYILKSFSRFSICRSFPFSRSTNLRMRFFFFDFWVTQSPLKLAYTCVHRHIHIHTCAHLIATYTIDCASHWETCIHSMQFNYLSNLSCIFLNSTDHWVDTFNVVKFFHKHFCFTFSCDVFRLFRPPEMTVFISKNNESFIIFKSLL